MTVTNNEIDAIIDDIVSSRDYNLTTQEAETEESLRVVTFQHHHDADDSLKKYAVEVAINRDVFSEDRARHMCEDAARQIDSQRLQAMLGIRDEHESLVNRMARISDTDKLHDPIAE